jgi:hypothetical protein
MQTLVGCALQMLAGCAKQMLAPALLDSPRGSFQNLTLRSTLCHHLLRNCHQMRQRHLGVQDHSARN